MYTHVTETIAGLSIIRCYVTTTRFIDEMLQKIDTNTVTQYCAKAASEWLNLRLQALAVLVTGAVSTLAVAFHYYHVTNMDAGLIGLSLAYSLTLTSLLNGVMQSFASTETELVSVERVMQFVTGIERERSSGQVPLYWPSDGTTVFANVTLRYASDLPPALRHVSFTIKAREHVGIVGRTGSGKSTLFKALFGLVEPEEGAILIDQVDIKHLTLNCIRSNIFIIPQDPTIFSTTVRDNLDPVGVYNDENIEQALRAAHAFDLVNELGGLDAHVTSTQLSSGQKQLLCLATGLLYNCKVICLDEATANVDPEMEAAIRQTISQSLRNSTVLIIAHKIDTVVNLDKVIVMEGGRVAEMDCPQLLRDKQDSLFYKLYTQQIS